MPGRLHLELCPWRVKQTFSVLSTVKQLCGPSSSLNDIPILGNMGLSNVNFGKDEPSLIDVLLVDFKQGYTDYLGRKSEGRSVHQGQPRGSESELRTGFNESLT